MTQLEGQVGPQALSDGNPAVFYMGRRGEMMVGNSQGYFEEWARRGLLFVASSAAAGVTIAAANVSPLPVTTGQPIVGLYNPVGSGVDIVIVRTRVWTVSGTPGGPFHYNVCAPSQNVTAAGSKALNCRSFAGDGKALVFANAVPTGAPVFTMLRPIGGPAAVAAGAGRYDIDEITDGDIVVPPGGLAGIAATAAGTTHIAGGSIAFIERPI